MTRGIFFTLFLLSINLCVGQIKDTSGIKNGSRISPGFNYHLQISHVDISPVLYYRLSERIHPGFGINYLYHFKNDERQGKSSYGFNLFTRIYIHSNIFTHVEYLYSDVAYLNQLIYEYHRVRKADFFLGGGYRQPITDKTDAYLMVLVNPNRSDESPYKNLILFKAGLSF